MPIRRQSLMAGINLKVVIKRQVIAIRKRSLIPTISLRAIMPLQGIMHSKARATPKRKGMDATKPRGAINRRGIMQQTQRSITGLIISLIQVVSSNRLAHQQLA